MIPALVIVSNATVLICLCMIEECLIVLKFMKVQVTGIYVSAEPSPQTVSFYQFPFESIQICRSFS